MKKSNYRSLTVEELEQKTAYLTQWRHQAQMFGSWYTDYTKCKQANFRNPELDFIGFVYYEEGGKDKELFTKGALFILGDDFVQRFNAEWVIIENNGHQDYALIHEAFDEPVVLRLLQEYCNPEDLEPQDYTDQKFCDIPAGPGTIFESAYNALLQRLSDWQNGIRDFKGGIRIKRPLRATIGIETFPPL